MRGINKLSKKSESIRISKWVFWYVLFLAVVVFWHLLMREYSGDAVNYFSKVMESDTLFNVLKNRYNEWSSRVFVEAILILLSKDVIVWKIFNIAVYALFAFSLMRLTNYKYPQLLFGLWIIYPVIEMQSAGWKIGRAHV